MIISEESSQILEKLTDNVFSTIDGRVWLYFLVEISLIPGAWFCRFYLENSSFVFEGMGELDSCIKDAYSKIDKDWLENGFKRGKKEQEYMDYLESKMKYWRHFRDNKQFWAVGITEKRLYKARDLGLIDFKPLWDDVLERHNGKNLEPEEMKENPAIYEHCMSNMTSIIRKWMVDNNIIK